MKRLLFTILIIAVVSIPTQAKYSGGSGTIDDPYQIGSTADLLTLAADTNDYDKYFILTANIDLDPNLPGNQIFTTAVIAPDIDNSNSSFDGNAFTGDFNGNDHTISNLTIDTNEVKGDYLGLFGYISNGQNNQISNLRLENIRITSGDNSFCIGGLVGSNMNNGWWGSNVINNCSSTGTIIGGANSYCIGGLIGANASTYRGISNCFFTGTISGGVGSYYLGGLAGHSNSDISNSFSKGTVTSGDGSSYLGGLVGGYISRLVDRYGYMSNCYSTVDVTGRVGSSQLGGLAGLNGSGIGNCYSTGAVTGGANSWGLGGLVGRDAVGIWNCYSTGVITGGENSSSLGGLVGVNSCWWGGCGGSFNSYFLDISGPNNGLGTPLTNEQMKQQASFISWDFVGETTNGTQDIWSIIEDVYYPKLAWQIIPPDLNEVSSSVASLVETVYIERSVLEDGNVVGDLNGVFDFNSFDIVLIKTGPWAGKGFSKSQCQATFEGANYAGEWRGILLPDVNSSKIHLKGSITGGIMATVEGTLTESIPGSGVYDKYQATWKVGWLGNVITSVTVKATGTLVDKNSSEYPATGLYVLQTAMDGNLIGDYNSPLSTVINHVRIADGNNPYDGNGFSIISYVSQTGSGQGYTCDQLLPSGVVTMKGLFTDPLYGVLSASLNETTTPRALYLSLQRIDLGLPPMANLEVKIWGPGNVSPGQTINYIVEYKNIGLITAYDTVMVAKLPIEVEYISSTSGGIHKWQSHEVIWKLGAVGPGTKSNLAVIVRVQWGLSGGAQFETSVAVDTNSPEIDKYLNPEISIDDFQKYLDYSPREITSIQNLTSDQLAEMLSSDPEMEDMYIYAHELGFIDAISSTRIILNNGSESIFTPLVSDSNAETILLLRYFNQQSASVLMKFDNNTISFFNRENGFMYDSITDKFSMWGKHGSCSWTQCVKHCVWQKLGPYLQEKATDLVLDKLTRDIFTKIKSYFYCEAWFGAILCCNNSSDCPDGFTQQQSCIDAPNLCISCLKSLPVVDVIVELEECMVNCTMDKGSYGGADGDYCERCEDLETKIRYRWENCELIGGEVSSCGGYSSEFLEGGKICKQTGYCNAECIGPENRDKGSTTIAIARDPSVKYGPEGNVLPGQKLNYKVEYENEGEGIAFGVYFTDTLDEDLNDATLEIGPIIDVNTGAEIAPPGYYNPATRTITWFAGEVGPGKGGFSDVNICIRSDANEGTEIINYATIYFPSVPEETRTNGIVSTVSLNRPPVANAGPDQTVYAWIDGIAEVNLDGSGSYDADDDELTYFWSWTIDGNDYDANGVKPTIELPVGQHVISLIVNDGIVDSEPNDVVITVVGPVEVNLCVMPKVINARSFQPKITAMLRLPKGITKDQIDTSVPILLYPGEIEADWTWFSKDFDNKGKCWSATIFASFDKDELMDAIDDNGLVELAVVGRLKTGQYFFGTDDIRVISPGNWPWHHRPWWNYRWNRCLRRPI